MATLKRYTTFDELKVGIESNTMDINECSANLNLFEYKDFLNLLRDELINKKKTTKDKIVDGKQFSR